MAGPKVRAQAPGPKVPALRLTRKVGVLLAQREAVVGHRHAQQVACGDRAGGGGQVGWTQPSLKRAGPPLCSPPRHNQCSRRRSTRCRPARTREEVGGLVPHHALLVVGEHLAAAAQGVGAEGEEEHRRSERQGVAGGGSGSTRVRIIRRQRHLAASTRKQKTAASGMGPPPASPMHLNWSMANCSRPGLMLPTASTASAMPPAHHMEGWCGGWSAADGHCLHLSFSCHISAPLVRVPGSPVR